MRITSQRRPGKHKTDPALGDPELRTAKDKLDEATTKLAESYEAFAEARGKLSRVTDQTERAEAEHALSKASKAYENAQDMHSEAKDNFSKASMAVAARNKRRRLETIRQAHLSAKERRNAKVVWKDDRTAQIYFGGIDRSDGEGHGHIVITDGAETYRRNPFEEHGSQNFIKK